jgi:hypothetical protein
MKEATKERMQRHELRYAPKEMVRLKSGKTVYHSKRNAGSIFLQILGSHEAGVYFYKFDDISLRSTILKFDGLFYEDH